MVKDKAAAKAAAKVKATDPKPVILVRAAVMAVTVEVTPVTAMAGPTAGIREMIPATETQEETMVETAVATAVLTVVVMVALLEGAAVIQGRVDPVTALATVALVTAAAVVMGMLTLEILSPVVIVQ